MEERGNNVKYTARVNLTWDSEACVWIATSDDSLGLVLEHSSFDVLLERVRLAVPELLSMQGSLDGDIALDYAATRHDHLAIYG